MQKIEEGKYSLEKEWFSIGLDLQNLANQYEITVANSSQKWQTVFISRNSIGLHVLLLFSIHVSGWLLRC